MKNLVIAVSLLILGGVLGAAVAAPRGPLWTYHNGNTLQGQSAREETGDDGLWLDSCLSAGWTLKRADRELAERFAASIPLFPNPAAAIVLDNLKDACGAK